MKSNLQKLYEVAKECMKKEFNLQFQHSWTDDLPLYFWKIRMQSGGRRLQGVLRILPRACAKSAARRLARLTK